MMLPLLVGLMFAVIGFGSTCYKRFILGRTRNLTRHVGTLVSSLMLIAYFLYIYITRLLLDVFNCAPTDPSDGKLYLQASLESTAGCLISREPRAPHLSSCRSSLRSAESQAAPR
jgi:hypothetical protein